MAGRAVEIDPSTDLASGNVVEKCLISFVHYSDSNLLPEDTVLLKVGDWHIQYNRAKLYNVEVDDVPNTVTVTTASGDLDPSERNAALLVGERHSQVVEFGDHLVVAVCEALQLGDNEVDYAVVRIYQGSEEGIDLCEATQRVSHPLDHRQPPAGENNVVDDSNPNAIIEKEGDDDEDSLSSKDLIVLVAFMTGSVSVLALAIFAVIKYYRGDCCCQSKETKNSIRRQRVQSVVVKHSNTAEDLSDTEEMDDSINSASELITEAKAQTTTE